MFCCNSKNLGFVIYYTVINCIFIISAKVKDKFLIIVLNYSVPGNGLTILRCFLGNMLFFSVSLEADIVFWGFGESCNWKGCNSPIEHLTLSWVNVRKPDSHILKNYRSYTRGTTNFTEVLCTFQKRIVMTNIHYYTPRHFLNLLLPDQGYFTSFRYYLHK